MNLQLPADLEKLIEDRVRAGRYATPVDVVAAALQSLDQQDCAGDFAPGELDALLAEGERSIQEQGTLDGEEAYQQRRRKRSQDHAP